MESRNHKNGALPKSHMSRKTKSFITMKTKPILIALSTLLCFIIAQAQPQTKTDHMKADHIMVMPTDIKWSAAPPSLPPGAQVSVIEGDPSKEGLFTMRIKLPANYKIMPHSHPADEHITVIEGSFYMGTSEKYDEKVAREIPAGGFAVMNTGTRHFAFTKNGCVIQLHCKGPWGVNYVNPADDPRNKK